MRKPDLPDVKSKEPSTGQQQRLPKKVTVRLYENIIDESKGVYNEDGSLNLNPNSLTVKECFVEPALAEAKPYEASSLYARVISVQMPEIPKKGTGI